MGDVNRKWNGTLEEREQGGKHRAVHVGTTKKLRLWPTPEKGATAMKGRRTLDEVDG